MGRVFELCLFVSLIGAAAVVVTGVVWLAVGRRKPGGHR